jgi:hypothetical protein
MRDIDRDLISSLSPRSARSRLADSVDRLTLGQPLTTTAVTGLQRTAGNAATAQLLADEDPSLVHEVVGRGGGSALPEGVRGRMESSFGEDFSGVRLHTDDTAAKSAAAVQASAYTVGSDIVLGANAPSLDSSDGQRTLAHELTHVVQQRSGPVDGTPVAGNLTVSDPSDRFEREADRTASAVVSGDTAPARGAAAAVGVQREDDPDALGAIQREEMPEEDEAEM